MKQTFAFLFIMALPFLGSAQCSEIKEIISDYNTEKYSSKAAQAATKAALTLVLKKVVGGVGGIITGVLNPTMLGTPYDAFIASLKRMQAITSANTIDWNKYYEELTHLKSEAQGVRIEQIFGNNKECYDNLDAIVRTYETIQVRARALP